MSKPPRTVHVVRTSIPGPPESHQVDENTMIYVVPPDQPKSMTSWVPCPDCEGRGWVYVGLVDYNTGEPEAVDCPKCSGLGELPSDGLIEAAVRAVGTNREGFAWIDKTQARAALVAARVYQSREK